MNVEAGDEITLNASVTDFAFGQNDGKGQLTKTGGGTLNLFGMGKVSSDNIYSYYILEKLCKKSLIYINNIVYIYKRKLHIYLSKLRLSVCTKILISVAACKLEVSVIS